MTVLQRRWAVATFNAREFRHIRALEIIVPLHQTNEAGGCRLIVARDHDLTVLEKPFGVLVLTARAFLATSSAKEHRQLR